MLLRFALKVEFKLSAEHIAKLYLIPAFNS